MKLQLKQIILLLIPYSIYIGNLLLETGYLIQ